MRECNKKQKIGYAVVLGIILLFCFFTMLYTDNIINSNIGYRLIDSIFRGKFKEFYNSMDWSYGLTIYMIYAIWSVPVWCISHILPTPIDMMSVSVLLWYKLLLALFAFVSVILTGKISEIAYKEYTKNVQFHYMSSMLLVLPVLYIAQCDIIGLCFVLLGIYFYIQDKNKIFLICFAIAITMKYFALFVFIPLILFKYRKINRMFLILVAGLGLMIISFVLIGNSDTGSAMLHDENFYVNQHIQAFSDISLQIGENRSIGLFGFFYMLLCIIAYIIPNQDIEKNKQYIIWLTFSGYMILFLFYPCNFYWFVLLAPFLILVSYFKKENLRINLLLEVLFCVLIVVYYSYMQDWVIFGEGTYKYLVLRNLGQAVECNSIRYFIEHIFHIDLNVYIPLILGVIYACAMMLMIINFPGICIRAEKQSDEEFEKEINTITWLRLGVLVGLILISIYCLGMSQKDFYLRDNANIQIVDEEIVQNHCELQGDLFFLDDGAWMNEECTITFNREKSCNQNLKLSVYGYTITGEDKIEVFVNSQYVGDLEKEDIEANVTNRYIIIPNDFFAEDTVEQSILLRSKPQIRTVGDIVENGIVVGKDERPISAYIQSISVEVMK